MEIRAKRTTPLFPFGNMPNSLQALHYHVILASIDDAKRRNDDQKNVFIC